MIDQNRVFLRAFELDDYKKLNKWRNNDDIFELTGGNKYFISSEYDKKWVEDKIFNNNKNIYLGICLSKTNGLIGYLSINNIDPRNRTASWGGIVIGEKELWNQGCATEAAKIMVKFVFEELGLVCFYTRWLVSHSSSLKMGEKVGFKQEGVLRKRVFKNNKHHNQVVGSITYEDYMALKQNGIY
jgi:[ribosomal protein S5]-alanine N-acetyltransferase